jgi:hypothetical protein
VTRTAVATTERQSSEPPYHDDSDRNAEAPAITERADEGGV